MATISKENKLAAKPAKDNVDRLYKEIMNYDKEHKQKLDVHYKHLIKLCKEFEKNIVILQNYGYKTSVWHKKLNYRTWEAEFKTKINIRAPKIENNTNNTNIQDKTNLYYINLAWTVKPNYYVCNSVIDKVKNYFEKMKLTYIFTYIDEFPDRIEYSHEYKIKCTEDVYNTIIISAEYILEISTDSAYESCNIGIFGRKIE